MKTISKKKIEKQIKKQYKEGEQWNKIDFGHYYKIMIDADDGDIWSDTFLSVNSWAEYRSEEIQSLELNNLAYLMNPEEIVAEYVADAIQKLQSAGWKIEEEQEVSYVH